MNDQTTLKLAIPETLTRAQAEALIKQARADERKRISGKGKRKSSLRTPRFPVSPGQVYVYNYENGRKRWLEVVDFESDGMKARMRIVGGSTSTEAIDVDSLARRSPYKLEQDANPYEKASKTAP